MWLFPFQRQKELLCGLKHLCYSKLDCPSKSTSNILVLSRPLACFHKFYVCFQSSGLKFCFSVNSKQKWTILSVNLKSQIFWDICRYLACSLMRVLIVLGPISCLSMQNVMLEYHYILLKVMLLVLAYVSHFKSFIGNEGCFFFKYLANTTAGLRFCSHCLALVVTWRSAVTTVLHYFSFSKF